MSIFGVFHKIGHNVLCVLLVAIYGFRAYFVLISTPELFVYCKVKFLLAIVRNCREM